MEQPVFEEYEHRSKQTFSNTLAVNSHDLASERTRSYRVPNDRTQRRRTTERQMQTERATHPPLK